MERFGRSSVFTEKHSASHAGRDPDPTGPSLGLEAVEVPGSTAEDEIEDLDGEVVYEEDLGTGETVPPSAVPEPYGSPGAPAEPIKGEVTTAALAVAGGALAGAATVAAVRAVGSVATGGRRSRRRRSRRRPRASEVVASRSFLVDIHVLGR